MSNKLIYYYIIGIVPKRNNKIPILGNVYSLLPSFCYFYVKNFNQWEKPNIHYSLIIEGSTIYLLTHGTYGFAYDKEYLFIFPNIMSQYPTMSHYPAMSNLRLKSNSHHERYNEITRIYMKPQINLTK